jgi:hypothetical protein
MARDPYRRQMRRLRRTVRKNNGNNNPYAVLILDHDEPLGIIIAGIIAKWVYRHRSALLPFGAALAEFITAAITHIHHARYWIPVTVITITGAVVPGFPLSVLRRHPAGHRISRALSWVWEKCGIPRVIERAYITAVIAVSGGAGRRYRGRPDDRTAALGGVFRHAHSRGSVVVPPPPPGESPGGTHHLLVARYRR